MTMKPIPTRFEGENSFNYYGIADYKSKLVIWDKVDKETYRTKTQWNEAGYKVKPDAVAVLWVQTWYKRYKYFTALFTIEQCVAKRQPTEAQLAALARAKYMAEQIGLHCCKCGDLIDYHATRKYAEQHPNSLCFICQDRWESIEWARKLLAGKFLILDTETTGLHAPEPMQIAVINERGETLLNTLVKPAHPEKALEKTGHGRCAFDIHGIHPDIVKDAPRWNPTVFEQLREILTGQQLVIYNRSFDLPMLESPELRGIDWKTDREAWTAAAHNPLKLKTAICAMNWYSQYCGEWWASKQDYKWQSLPGGDHSALGDCIATLAVIRGMATDEDFDEKEPEDTAVQEVS